MKTVVTEILTTIVATKGIVMTSSKEDMEPSEFQQIREVLLDLVELLNHHSGLNNEEIAKLHFDNATERLTVLIASRERLAKIAELKNFVMTLDKQDPYTPLDGTPKDYVHQKLNERLNSLTKLQEE